MIFHASDSCCAIKDHTAFPGGCSQIHFEELPAEKGDKGQQISWHRLQVEGSLQVNDVIGEQVVLQDFCPTEAGQGGWHSLRPLGNISQLQGRNAGQRLWIIGRLLQDVEV